MCLATPGPGRRCGRETYPADPARSPVGRGAVAGLSRRWRRPSTRHPPAPPGGRSRRPPPPGGVRSASGASDPTIARPAATDLPMPPPGPPPPWPPTRPVREATAAGAVVPTALPARRPPPFDRLRRGPPRWPDPRGPLLEGGRAGPPATVAHRPLPPPPGTGGRARRHPYGRTAPGPGTPPDPGRPAIHRLNRAEYTNAVRDLLALDIDERELLPADDSGYVKFNISNEWPGSPDDLSKFSCSAFCNSNKQL